MNTKKIIMIVAIVVAVPVVFFAGFYAKGYYEQQQREAATKVAKNFVNDLVAGKTTEAYALTSKSLHVKQDQEAFTKAMSSLKADAPKYEDAQVMNQGNQVFYVQRVTGLPATPNSGDAGNFYLALSKDGGSWKVTTATVF